MKKIIISVLFLTTLCNISSVLARTHNNGLLALLNSSARKAFHAYNSENYPEFRACFSDSMGSAVTRDYFEGVFIDLYKEDLGFLEKFTLLGGQSSFDSDYPVLVYSARFEKHKDVLITVNFMNENGYYKITQLRFDRQYPDYE